MSDLEVRVLWADTLARVTDATIRIVPETGGTQRADADKDGKRQVAHANGDGEAEFVNLASGNWKVEVFGPNIRTARPSTVELKGAAKETIEVKVVHQSRTVCQRCGILFFVALILSFFMALYAWYWTHQTYPQATLPSVSEQVRGMAEETSALLSTAQPSVNREKLQAVITGVTGNVALAQARNKDANEKLTSISVELDEMLSTLTSGEKDLRENLIKEFKATPDDVSLKALVAALNSEPGIEKVEQARIYLIDHHLTRISSNVEKLERGEARLVQQSGSYPLWSTTPKLYLEILFFAVFGTLVRLIMVVQGYLRFNRYYKQGLYQHIALLVTVPVLTLIFVSVVSMARLTAANSTIVVDLSNPVIVSGIAFLVALLPWGLWERLLGAASQVLGSNENGEDK